MKFDARPHSLTPSQPRQARLSVKRIKIGPSILCGVLRGDGALTSLSAPALEAYFDTKPGFLRVRVV